MQAGLLGGLCKPDGWLSGQLRGPVLQEGCQSLLTHADTHLEQSFYVLWQEPRISIKFWNWGNKSRLGCHCSRKYRRVSSSAGKKLSIINSDMFSSVAVPKMV